MGAEGVQKRLGEKIYHVRTPNQMNGIHLIHTHLPIFKECAGFSAN